MLGGMAFKAVIARPAAAVHDTAGMDDAIPVENDRRLENGRGIENVVPAQTVAPVEHGVPDPVPDPDHPEVRTPVDGDGPIVTGTPSHEPAEAPSETA